MLQLIVIRTPLFDNQRTSHLEQRSCILNEHVSLSNSTSKHIIKRGKSVLRKVLHTSMKHLQTCKTKLLSELNNCLDLLSNRIDEDTRSAGKDMKGNSRKASTGAHIDKGRVCRHMLTKHCQRKQGVNKVKRHSLRWFGDSGEVEDLVLLENQIKIGHKCYSLLMSAGYPKE